MKRESFVGNIYGLLLFLILAFNIDFFYLLPSNAPLIGELDWLISFVVFIYVFLRYHPNLLSPKYRYFWVLEIGAFILMLTSSYRAHINYHQPMWYGIRAQRENIFFPFLFLAYFILLDRRVIFKKQIYNAIVAFVCVEMLLGYMQVLVFPNNLFLNVGGGMRYGSRRLWMNISSIVIVDFLSLNELIHRKNRLRNCIIFIACFLFVPVVTQWRLPTIALFVATFIVIFCFSKLSSLYKVGILLLTLFIGLVFLQTNMGNDILSLLKNGGQTDTSEIRNKGRQIFLNSIVECPLFGGGFINIDWPEAYFKSGYANGIYAADNGVFGFMFYFGLIGVLYSAYIHIMLFSSALRRLNKNESIDLLGVVFNSLLGLMTVFGLGMGNFLILAMLGLLFPEVAYLSHKTFFVSNSKGQYHYYDIHNKAQNLA